MPLRFVPLPDFPAHTYLDANTRTTETHSRQGLRQSRPRHHLGLAIQGRRRRLDESDRQVGNHEQRGQRRQSRPRHPRLILTLLFSLPTTSSVFDHDLNWALAAGANLIYGGGYLNGVLSFNAPLFEARETRVGWSFHVWACTTSFPLVGFLYLGRTGRARYDP